MLATSTISLSRFSQPVHPLVEQVEIHDDHFVMSLPLCRGSVKIEAEGGTIYDGEVRPGMLRIASPGERLRVERRSRAEAMVLTIPGPLFRRMAAERTDRVRPSGFSAIQPIVTPDPQVERLTSSLLGLSEIDAAGRPMFLEGITQALLALALGTRRNPAADASRPGLSAAAFARCLDYADAHLADGVNLAAWAGALGLPSGEFVRRFQHTTQVAPYGWFLHRRIDRAKLLLEDPHVTLAEVAVRVGFSSQSHFSEAFRRRTGLSPGHWRRRAEGSR